MRNLIYQFWYGQIPPYAKLSGRRVGKYAEHVGAEHRIDLNSPFFQGPNANYMNCLRPIYDRAFEDYDNVLFLDMDIFPIWELPEECNIFELEVQGIGMVREPLQPELRENSTSRINTTNDKKWAIAAKAKFNVDVPLDEKRRPLVYNSGVVYYTKEAREQARKWPSYEEYVTSMGSMDRFYLLDQNYLGVMVHSGKTKFTEMDIKWNSQVHYTGDNTPRDVIDNRVEDTIFVHVQTRPRDILTDNMIFDIVNKPVKRWRHRRRELGLLG